MIFLELNEFVYLFLIFFYVCRSFIRNGDKIKCKIGRVCLDWIFVVCFGEVCDYVFSWFGVNGVFVFR